MTLFDPLERKIGEAWPPQRWREMTVLAAVSGGPDSVALLRALDRLRPGVTEKLVVGHFHHGLRGERATADQQFVVDLCRSLGIRCELGQADLSQRLTGDGLEAAARESRYRFLQETAERLGARYVVTGHTADDQAETILHHILRGTGLSGLAGMRRVRLLSPAVTLVRPLLEVSRREVFEYLGRVEQPFCQDETNLDRSLTRNRIRHELLPLLAENYSPTIVEALLRLGGLAGDAQRVVEKQAEALLEQVVVERDDAHVVFRCEMLRRSRPPRGARDVCPRVAPARLAASGNGAGRVGSTRRIGASGRTR